MAGSLVRNADTIAALDIAVDTYIARYADGTDSGLHSTQNKAFAVGCSTIRIYHQTRHPKALFKPVAK